MIKTLFIVLGVCVGVPSFIAGLWLFMDKVVFGEPRVKKRAYTEEKKSGKPCITFQQFFDWYSVNPKPWSWKDSSWPTSFGECVLYIPEEKSGYRYAELYGKALYWETYDDKIQFMNWAREQEKQQALAKGNEDLVFVMNRVQKDIDKRMVEIQQDTKAKLEKILAEQEAALEQQRKLYSVMEVREGK